MSSVHEKLRMKKEPCDTWSTREQLCLASSVLKSGDQNWISVSRSLKPFTEKEALRPPDWFSQKSCAVQYAILLENADTPKRKKRECGETSSESIFRRLRQERIAELGQILAFQRDEYQQLKAEVNLLKFATVTDEKLQKMWVVVEQEEREQERKARVHSVWLAKRQQKLEFSSPQTLPISVSTPEKIVENDETEEFIDSVNGSGEEKKSRIGQTALLTSLLTSPTPTNQIQNATSVAQVTSPTIASLLSSNTKIHPTQPSPRMSPQLHQLVSSAMGTTTNERPSAGAPTLSMLLALPANLSRGTLSSLQTTTVQTPVIDVTTAPIILKSQNSSPVHPHVVTTTAEIVETKNMVQIIDNIDEVIGNDKIAEVIDKDEINEIIGDIEELIKEEITCDPQTTTPTLSVIETLPITIKKHVQIQERLGPHDIDDPISLTSIVETEMSIDDEDRSTPNIAKIFGPVIDSSEPKVIVNITSANDVSVEKKAKEIPSIESEQVKTTDDTGIIFEEYIQVSKMNQQIEEEDDTKLSTQNEGKIEKGAENMEQIVIIQDKAVDKSYNEKFEKPKQVGNSIKSEQFHGIDHKHDESEEKINETSIESGKAELIKTKRKLAEIDEIEVESSISKPIETYCEKLEVKNIQNKPLDAMKEETLISDGISESFENQKLEEKISDNDVVPETITDRSPNEISVKSPVNSYNSRKGSDITESLPKEEADYKIVETNPGISPSTMPIEPKDVREEKNMEATNQIFETEDEIEDVITRVEDIVVKQELIEEVISATEEIKAEVASEELIEVKALKNIVEIKEIRKAREVKQFRKVEEVVREVRELKDMRGIKLGKPEKIEKLEKIDKFGKDDGSKKKKELDMMQVKKEDSISSLIDAGIEEEESSITKLSAGRAMKTYSKKQNVSIDSEPEMEGSGEGADYRAWKKAVMLVYNRLATHKYASVFLRPITEDQAPGYHSVIFRPMDLSTIKKNIDNGTIRSTMHFQRDVMLMFQNAIIYNKHDTFVYQMAVTMQEECLQHMQILVEVTGEGPFRRETRTAASNIIEASENNATKRKRSHIIPSPHDTESTRMKKQRKSEND